MPSIGTYGTKYKVRYFFGFPRSASIGGTIMDVGNLIAVTNARNGNADERIAYSRNTGLLSSALEHAIPEMLFSQPGTPIEAVSAVKLLNMANAQGMPVYQINRQNKAAVLPKLQLSSNVMRDIQAALAFGKEVTVHQSNITTSFGWTGSGYIVFDPVTGDGAYRISGGLNGAVSSGPESMMLAAFMGFVAGLNKVKGWDAKNLLKIAKGLAFVAGPLAWFMTVLQVFTDNTNRGDVTATQGWQEVTVWTVLAGMQAGIGFLIASSLGGIAGALLVAAISIALTYIAIEIIINPYIYRIVLGAVPDN